MKGNTYTLIIAVLGAIKLVTESFGLKIIEDSQVDAIANGISAVLAVGGIILNHMKPKAPDTPAPAPAPDQPKV